MDADYRVAHLLEATVGGTARHLWDIATGLAGLGIRQEAILSRRAEEDFTARAEGLVARGIPVTWIPMAREVSPRADLRALWQISHHLRRSRPLIVHTHSSKAGVLGRVAARLAGIPIVVHSPHSFPFQMRVGRAHRGLYLAIERVLAPWTDCLVAVSHAERDLAVSVARYPPERVTVIENGVEIGEAAPPEEGLALRRELGISNETPLVLFVGRLVPQKAPDVLFRAALLVLAKHPEALFLVVGAGPRFEAVREELKRWTLAPGRQKAAERIWLLGHRLDIERFYAAAQVFVLPSRWEGLPYSPLEAMRAGLPVVASDLPPLREIIVPDVTGLLVPPDAPDSLASALCALLENPERARALGSAGRTRVATFFSLERQVRRLAELYDTLAARQRNRKARRWP